MDNSECGVPDNTNVNMKYQIQFMQEEYKQMFNSWFNLKKEKADYIKTYITLVTLPPTIIIAVMRISSPDLTTPLNILDFIDPLKPIFLMISVLGFLISAILIDTRLESIMYIRNINSIRNAFCELSNDFKSNKFNLSETLTLPLSSDTPPFQEYFQYRGKATLESVTYNDLLFTAFINSIYFYVSALKMFNEQCNIQFLINSFFISNISVSVIYFFLHIFFYRHVSKNKEKNWKKVQENRARKNQLEGSVGEARA